MATISDSVVQFGLAMIPLGRSATISGLTSGTTSGTSGSMRNAPELSTATAPRAAATGAHAAETSSGTSNMATSTPSKTSSASATTSVSWPRTGSCRPAERGDATSRMSPHTSSLVDSRSSITVPTAPVAPTTASTGRAVTAPAHRAYWTPQQRGPGAASPARPPVHHGLDLAGVQAEGPVRGGHRGVQVFLVHDDRDPDLRGGDHLDVHPGAGDRAEEGGRHPRVGLHPSSDQGHLADPVVVEQALELDLRLHRAQRRQRRLPLGAREGERDVGEPGGGRGDVLHDHVDVDASVRDRPEDLRRLAHHVGNSRDGDLGLTPVVRDARDDRLLHAGLLLRSMR